MDAAGIYIDPNGGSHIIDDPNVPVPGVPQEALDELKKRTKLCGITYDAKNTAGLTNGQVQGKIDGDIKRDNGTREKNKTAKRCRGCH